MKSLGILAAFAAALVVAGCSTSSSGSDGMMSGKNGKCSSKKDGFCTAETQKKDCCGAEEAKKSGCCEGKGSETSAGKKGCCAEGTTKLKSGCCKGKDVSEACAECKKACEAAGSCDADKKCDEKSCEEKPKP
ncbi:MAG TPA: hypothetical protein VGK61_10310 [Planctomycetota bacterium]